MTQQRFLNNQVLELERLLAKSTGNPVLELQLRARVDEARKAVANAAERVGNLFPAETAELVRAAIFLRGGGVEGSIGIKPSLAGEALIQYERMYVEQATFEERVAAQKAGRLRRPRGATTPGLLFCGTPRGSFGLEFAPQPQNDAALAKIHSETITKVADSVVKIVEDGDSALPDIPPRVLQPLKQFLKVLAEYGAELRFAFSATSSRAISVEEIRRASDQLEREVSEKKIPAHGVFRGVTFESGIFDLNTDDGLISGVVADSLSEDDLVRISGLNNKQCVAQLSRTTVTKLNGSETVSYVLLDAQVAEEGR